MYEEYFSTIPKTVSYFAAEKISKTWMSQIRCFNPLKSTLWAPLNSNLEKCRKYFLGICMKNILVQFWKWYLILRPRKCKKYECRRYSHFTHLCPWNFEFRKMQKSVFRYLYEERSKTISKTISYFAVEKISKTWMSEIPHFYPLKSKYCKTLS